MSRKLRLVQTLAASAHDSQRYGKYDYYDTHILDVVHRVGIKVAHLPKTEQEDYLIVAYLHDVLEDTDCTIGEITIQFKLKVAHLVNVLSMCENIDYADYIECIGFSPSAICIKIADLEDNMNITRLNKPLKEGDLQRLKKYHDSWLYLTKRLKEM